MTKQEKIIFGQKISFIAHIQENEEPILVFLHGWGAKLEVFRNLYPENQSYAALDFPNCGNSETPKSPWKLEQYANLTAEWIEKIAPKNRKVILVGHSFGGRVIVKIIREKKILQKIQKIIFIGVPFYRNISWRKRMIGQIAKLLSALPAIKKMMRRVFYSFSKNSDYESLGNNEIMKKTFQNVISEDISVYLADLKDFDIHMMWGEDDEITPLWYAQEAQKKLPNASLEVFKNAKHLPFLDVPKEFLTSFQKKTLVAEIGIEPMIFGL